MTRTPTAVASRQVVIVPAFHPAQNSAKVLAIGVTSPPMGLQW
jgi:hypothetical protein